MAVSGNVNIDPIYPVGNLYSGAPTTGQWPQGGQVASNNSGAPAVSGAANPDYWLPIWSGEVLHAYDEYNSFEPLVVTETIQSGTTKRFPITGTVGITPVWNAGVELLGESGETSTPGWFDISLDSRPMASHFELDDIHLMLTQWDYRAEIARQAGLQLANARDKQIACMIAKGAFTANRSPFGTKLSGMNAADVDVVLAPDSTFNDLGLRTATEPRRASAALLLLEYIERYMVHLQEVNVDTQNAYLAVTPQAFHDIRTLGVPRGVAAGTGTTTVDTAFSVDRFGAGGYKPYMTPGGASGMGGPLTNGMTKIVDTLEYMGCTIMKSNHLLTQNVLAAGGTGNLVLGDAKYDFDWATKKVKAIMWQRNAICSLRLQGMKVESIKDVRRGTNFTVASIMAGAGILRPELCGAICGV